MNKMTKLETPGHLVRGADNYDSAIAVFEKYGKSLQLATAYQRKGWNLYSQGKNLEAVKYFEKSLAISLTSGEKFQHVAVQSLSSMGATLTLLGEFEKAGKYHFQSLKLRLKFQGETHPGVGACYNNIGEMYDLKGDSKEALEYYRKGLEIKMKSNAPVLSTVISLCSMAKMRLSMRHFKEARLLLDQGFKKLDEENLPPREAIACACDLKGMVLKQEGLFHDAEKMFRKAADLRNEIAPNNMPYLESLAHLAEINKIQGKFVSSIKFAESILELKENAIVTMPQTLVIVDALECIADIYVRKGDTQRHIKTLEKLQSELLRLERVFLSNHNDRDLDLIRRKLQKLKDKFRHV